MKEQFQIFLIMAAVLSGISHIFADHHKKFNAVYFFKPFAMLLIFILAFSRGSAISDYYKLFIILGLSFSAAGDIFLMLRRVKFIPGLISFLIAHLFYITAFAQGIFSSFNPFSILTVLFTTIVFFILFANAGGRYKTAVRFYFIILSVMLWMAFNRWLVEDIPGVSLALAGALLFVFSDAILAYNRFVRTFSTAQILILSAYYPARF